MIKKISSFAILLATLCSLSAQTPKDVKYKFTEATQLTMIGRLFDNNPTPYHRVDTVKYKGFTTKENLQVRESSGIACLFKTNSTTFTDRRNFPPTQTVTPHVGMTCTSRKTASGCLLHRA